MKPYFFFILLLVCGICKGQAQEKVKVKTPILLNKEALSGIGLEKVDLKDEPEKDFYQRRLLWGQDLGVFVVSTENWNNEMRNFPFDEFVYMFHGQAVVKPINGPMDLFNSGDYFFAHKGYTGDWEIRGGEHLHYELSVIATKRADTSLIKRNAIHQLLDPASLSGVKIVLDEEGLFEEVLADGIELRIRLKAEAPVEMRAVSEGSDQMMHLLSGMVVIEDQAGEKHQFFAGDFFLIPNGFTGNWSSRGHGLVKYLIIEASS